MYKFEEFPLKAWDLQLQGNCVLQLLKKADHSSYTIFIKLQLVYFQFQKSRNSTFKKNITLAQKLGCTSFSSKCRVLTI